MSRFDWSLDKLAVVVLVMFALFFAGIACLVFEVHRTARLDDRPRNPHTGVLERE